MDQDYLLDGQIVYEGGFSIVMYPGEASHHNLPSSAMVKEDTITIKLGTARLISNRLLFQTDDRHFTFQTRDVRYVVDTRGKVIWKNSNEPARKKKAVKTK
ncbi:MAG TPA: hypothetical protein VD998_02340 [Verrucomicrobiae bacterium]|nr:hypothetical protein [Verrucomicrobiae bacterium]